MKRGIMSSVGVIIAMATMGNSAKHMCQCPCKPDGVKLKNLINCFATWDNNVATDGNSYTENCKETEIIHCRIPREQDLFCKFDGTNNLVETTETPQCFYNCGMQTCNAFLIAHSPEEIDCIADVFHD